MLKIDPEFAALCPAQTPEERSKLEASLESEGCRNPIVTWANHDDTILDGHTRYRICRQFNIPFKTTAMALATREEAVNWIIDNQLGRRNVTEDQKKFLRGKRYQAEKKAEGGRSDRDVSGGQIVHPKTADRLGAEYGVSGKTIQRDAQFADAVDALAESGGQEARDAILSGAVKMGSAAKQITNLKPQERRKVAEMIASKEVRTAAEAVAKATEPTKSTPQESASHDELGRIVAALKKASRDVRQLPKTSEGRFVLPTPVCKKIDEAWKLLAQWEIVGPCPACAGSNGGDGCLLCDGTGLGTVRTIAQTKEKVCTSS